MQLSRASFATRAAARPSVAKRAPLALPVRPNVARKASSGGNSGIDSEALAEKANELAKDLKVCTDG
jgi:hypothetical protein